MLQLLAENAEQARQIAALRDEVARLKGLKCRPDIKPPSRPSAMERGTERVISHAVPHTKGPVGLVVESPVNYVIWRWAKPRLGERFGAESHATRPLAVLVGWVTAFGWTVVSMVTAVSGIPCMGGG